MSPSPQRARRRRNAVHDLLVDRRAQRRRIAAIALERRLRARRPARAARPADRDRRSSRPAPRPPELRQHFGHELVRRPHPLDLRRRPADNHCRASHHRRHRRRDVAPRPRPASGRRPPTGTSAGCGRTRRIGCVFARIHAQPLADHFDAVVASRARAGRRTSRTPRRRAPRSSRSPRKSAACAAARPASRPAPRCPRRPAAPCSSTSAVERLGLHHVRGNPSSTNPAAASAPREPLADDADHQVVADQPPGSITAFAAFPSGVPSCTASRRMSPVEIFGHAPLAREPLRLRSLPGARRAEHHKPDRHGIPAEHASRRPPRSSAPPADTRLLHEPVVVAHDELRLDLLHGVHRHADDDQQRRAAEIERARSCLA